MEQRKEAIAAIMKGIVVEFISKRPKGGQSCGIEIMPCRVSHPFWNLVIECCEYRSQNANRELAITLFELGLNEFIK
jgi:protein subunit release factor A